MRLEIKKLIIYVENSDCKTFKYFNSSYKKLVESTFQKFQSLGDSVAEKCNHCRQLLYIYISILTLEFGFQVTKDTR